MPIGPALPPHLAHLSGGRARSDSPEEAGPSIRSATPPEDKDDDDDFGPALPPHLAAARADRSAAGPSKPYTSPSPPRVISRAPPPVQPEEDDSDDEVIGPMPVGGPVKERSAVEEFMEREARWAKEREEAAQPKKQQREEWMLVPPSSGVLSSVDPLRKRPTQFSKSTTAPTDTDSSIWTETPAEKAQRIADEVAGIKRKKDAKIGAGRGKEEDAEENARKRRRDAEIKEGVERHNKERRGDSLLDEFQKRKKDSKEEEAPAIWDHSRDMGITGRLLSDQERSAKITEARGLNDRFGHSKRGAFDM